MLTRLPDFKGYIHDVGGPTANFRFPACSGQMKRGCCEDRQCLFPKPCPGLKVSHRDFLHTLGAMRRIPGIKKVFIRSGLRYDYIMADPDREHVMQELCRFHVSGQMKVAPEHVCDGVLHLMGKPGSGVFEQFADLYARTNQKLGMKQYLVPYLMSSHPGSTLTDAVELALYLKKHRLQPEQVQDFYPTPGTLSTCMYHTGLDPRTMTPVYVARSQREKDMQRALLQWKNPANHPLIREALRRCGREDLIGFGADCLVPPARGTDRVRYERDTAGKSRQFPKRDKERRK